ncbi:MAG: carbohydrate porin [Bacteroidota bacterium]
MNKIYIAICLIASFNKAISQNNNDSINKKLSFHFQQTTVYQMQPGVSGNYFSDFSLSPKEEDAVSLTTTLFLGAKLWKGAEAYFNPELAGGSGLSAARGVAGFTNGETFRIGNPAPQPYIARAFVTQKIALGNSKIWQDDGMNKLASYQPEKYISITAGKFSLADYFDNNQYSHDPRTQFLNWSLMSTGAWDYAANTRGYTVGIVLQYVTPVWSVRYALAMVPEYANGPTLETDLLQYNSQVVEVEKKVKVRNQKGTLKLLLFNNQAHMGNYTQAIAPSTTMLTPDITATRNGARNKYGFSLNYEQALNNYMGLFSRVSWNDGLNETWAFTEIDQSISAGISINGSKWKRNEDVLGLAFVANGISTQHRDYLKAGGKGFMIGDGTLNYAPEMIVELFYNALLHEDHFWLSPDYQLVINPAYNQDRGPAHVFAIRFHAEF